MNISNLSRHASAVCATVALLAGCNGATNVTPTQSAEFAPNVTRGVITVAHGFTELQGGKNKEHLKSSNGTSGRSGCIEIVNASGKAAGAYPGTFTGFAGFNVCPTGPGGFSGSFTITSGANTITGSFSGAGKGNCGRGGCGDEGNLTYKATLEPSGKTFSGRGAGAFGYGRPSSAGMDLTLHSM
jgi:hypothetical protein